MPSAEKVSDMAELNVIKVTPDDIEYIYKLYCLNNSFIDEYIYDSPILDADRHYSFQDFFEILDDDNTNSLICVEKKVLGNKQNGFYFLDEKVGFICYEKQSNNIIKILFLEAKNNNKEIYVKLIEGLVAKIGIKNNFKKIIIEVEETKSEILESLCKTNFIESKMLTPKSGPDIFVFERNL